VDAGLEILAHLLLLLLGVVTSGLAILLQAGIGDVLRAPNARPSAWIASWAVSLPTPVVSTPVVFAFIYIILAVQKADAPLRCNIAISAAAIGMFLFSIQVVALFTATIFVPSAR
jgi:hypothetical protein